MFRPLFHRSAPFPLVLGCSRLLVGVDAESSEVVQETPHPLFFLAPHTARAPHQFSEHHALRQSRILHARHIPQTMLARYVGGVVLKKKKTWDLAYTLGLQQHLCTGGTRQPAGQWRDGDVTGPQIQWCRVAIICRTVCFFIPLHFVITLEAPLDVEQEVACGSQGEEDGPPRNGNSIDSLGRLMWGISH